MNGSERRPRVLTLYEIADQLCDLFQRQFDALENGILVQSERERYLQRREQIAELQVTLKGLRAPPS
jgi:hypothetical protein